DDPSGRVEGPFEVTFELEEFRHQMVEAEVPIAGLGRGRRPLDLERHEAAQLRRQALALRERSCVRGLAQAQRIANVRQELFTEEFLEARDLLLDEPRRRLRARQDVAVAIESEGRR